MGSGYVLKVKATSFSPQVIAWAHISHVWKFKICTAWLATSKRENWGTIYQNWLCVQLKIIMIFIFSSVAKKLLFYQSHFSNRRIPWFYFQCLFLSRFRGPSLIFAPLAPLFLGIRHQPILTIKLRTTAETLTCFFPSQIMIVPFALTSLATSLHMQQIIFCISTMMPPQGGIIPLVTFQHLPCPFPLWHPCLSIYHSFSFPQ